MGVAPGIRRAYNDSGRHDFRILPLSKKRGGYQKIGDGSDDEYEMGNHTAAKIGRFIRNQIKTKRKKEKKKKKKKKKEKKKKKKKNSWLPALFPVAFDSRSFSSHSARTDCIDPTKRASQGRHGNLLVCTDNARDGHAVSRGRRSRRPRQPSRSTRNPSVTGPSFHGPIRERGVFARAQHYF